MITSAQLFVVIDTHPDVDSTIYGPFLDHDAAELHVRKLVEADIADGHYERSQVSFAENGEAMLGEDRAIFIVELKPEGTSF